MFDSRSTTCMPGSFVPSRRRSSGPLPRTSRCQFCAFCSLQGPKSTLQRLDEQRNHGFLTTAPNGVVEPIHPEFEVIGRPDATIKPPSDGAHFCAYTILVLV